MNKQTTAYLALCLGVLTLAFSPIFVSLAHVNGLTATFYRTAIARIVQKLDLGDWQVNKVSGGMLVTSSLPKEIKNGRQNK